MELMPTAFEQFQGKRALKTVFEILKLKIFAFQEVKTFTNPL